MRFWRDVGEAMTEGFQRQKFRDEFERAVRQMKKLADPDLIAACMNWRPR